MQYSVLLSILAATGALAAPTKRTIGVTGAPVTSGKGIEVRLEATNFFLQIPFAADVRTEKFLGDRFADVDFKTIEILAGGAAKPRCQITSRKIRQAVVASRGAATDTTFADAGNGKWTFDGGATTLKDIICDPAFEANNLNVNVAPASPNAVPINNAQAAPVSAQVAPSSSSTTTAARASVSAASGTTTSSVAAATAAGSIAAVAPVNNAAAPVSAQVAPSAASVATSARSSITAAAGTTTAIAAAAAAATGSITI